jgi:hypothetical protein
MNCRNNVISLSKIGQIFGLLKPSMLEMIMKHFLSFSVQNTSAYNVHFEIFSCAGKSKVFEFFMEFIVVRWDTGFEVFLSEGLFKPFNFWFRWFLCIGYHIQILLLLISF